MRLYEVEHRSSTAKQAIARSIEENRTVYVFGFGAMKADLALACIDSLETFEDNEYVHAYWGVREDDDGEGGGTCWRVCILRSLPVDLG